MGKRIPKHIIRAIEKWLKSKDKHYCPFNHLGSTDKSCPWCDLIFPALTYPKYLGECPCTAYTLKTVVKKAKSFVKEWDKKQYQQAKTAVDAERKALEEENGVIRVGGR